jgi:exopolyphosphatase/pppGpp-phosphohydrolase
MTRMPVAVVDIGTNTTRLLVAEVKGGDVVELERRTVITSLGQGVDSSGRLAQAWSRWPRARCATPRTGPSSVPT